MKLISLKKSLLNSLIAWLLSFVFSITVATGCSFILYSKYDSKNVDTGKIHDQINLTVNQMFSNNFIVILIIIIGSALLIFWRSHIVAKKLNENNFLDGIVVSTIPLLYALLFGLQNNWLLANVMTIILYLGCGVLGSTWKLEHALNKLRMG